MFTFQKWLIGALCCVSAAAWSQAAPDAVEQDLHAARAAIKKERSHNAALLEENEKACYQHFAVTDCLKKVRTQSYAQERELRQREFAINADERAERTNKQRSAREKKQKDFDNKHPAQTLDSGISDAAVSEERQRELDAAAARRAVPPKRTAEGIAANEQRRDQAAAHRSAATQQKTSTKAHAQQRRADDMAANVSDAQAEYDAKQADAANRQQKHDKRMQELESKKRKVAPLPAP